MVGAMIDFRFTPNAIRYAWRQLAQRAGISSLEEVGIPTFYGSPEEARFASPGIIVRRCADSTWAEILFAPENSLPRRKTREVLPTGASLPFQNDIPLLFGDSSKQFAEHLPNGSILFNSDILAATFFMLSRWEETLGVARDVHGRFTAAQSVAYKQRFLDIPIIDQYALILREWIKLLKPDWQPAVSRFKIKLTHDIDRPWRYAGTDGYFRALGSALLHGDVSGARAHAAFVRRIFSKTRDPFYTSIYTLGEISCRFGLQSNFYFMAAKRGEYQNGYDPALLHSCFQALLKDGHTIGLHPGYFTLNKITELQAEKQKLEAALGQPVTEGRQHYLRFQVPHTWRHWAQAGLKVDSTMGYADHEGFRCGTCHPYTPFDVERDEEMDLLEVPLIVMDGTLFSYRKFSPSEAKAKMIQIANRCAEAGGTFTLLWHNSSLDFEWNMWRQVYMEALEEIITKVK